MMDINQVIIIGRLTKDPELKYTPSGSAVLNMSIAVNEMKKKDSDEAEVSFFDVIVWNKSAENCAKYLLKGSKICIQGRLKQERWEKDGQKQSKVRINAQTVQFLDNKKGDKTASDDEPIPY